MLSLPILALLKELEGLREVEDGKVILLQFQVHHTQVVEVVLGVIRKTLLISLVVLAVLISVLRVEARWVDLGIVLLIEGKVVDGFEHILLPQVDEGLNVVY